MTANRRLEEGIAFHQAGQLNLAEPIYQEILRADPNHAQACHLMGVLKSQLGDFETALVWMQKAIRLDPTRVEFYSNLGKLLVDRNQPEEALVPLEKAISLSPNFAEAYNNRGNALLALNYLDEAIHSYRQAINLAPAYPAFYFNLGNALRQAGNLDEARMNFQSCLQLDSNFVEAYNNLGTMCLEQGAHEQAMVYLIQAIQRNPQFALSHKNLGNVYMEQGRYDQAIASYQEAAAINPAISLMSLVYAQQQACAWQDLYQQSQAIIDLVESESFASGQSSITPFTFMALPIPTTPAQQYACASAWSKEKYGAVKRLGLISNHRTGRPKIRLGYLSADFHGHAVAYLIAEMIESHDSEQFEIFGYSIGRSKESPLRQRIARGCVRFSDLSKENHAEAASKIARDGIDILVDLQGYTWGCRPEIFAHRPAPIQVGFLGYPGTTGSNFIDYIIVDDIVVPANQRPYFSEQLVALPGCYQPHDRHFEIRRSDSGRTDFGIPDDAFVFASFNNSYKITPVIFDVWMRLLQGIPKSILWLMEANPIAGANLRREVLQRGVSLDRIIFAKPLPAPDHVGRQHLADLFLDTFPVCAHTTASEALRIGLPVLTLMGEAFISRVAASLLLNLGFPELVTNSLEAYELKAFELATDRQKIKAIRKRLEQTVGSTTIFDGRAFARKIEKAYKRMWDIFLAGEAPRSMTSDEFS